MPDIIRYAREKREKEAETGTETKVEGPINTHKKTMTQYEFGNYGQDDPRKTIVKGQKPLKGR